MSRTIEDRPVFNIQKYLKEFVLADSVDLFNDVCRIKQERIFAHNQQIPKYINEFWYGS